MSKIRVYCAYARLSSIIFFVTIIQAFIRLFSTLVTELKSSTYLVKIVKKPYRPSGFFWMYNPEIERNFVANGCHSRQFSNNFDKSLNEMHHQQNLLLYCKI